MCFDIARPETLLDVVEIKQNLEDFLSYKVPCMLVACKCDLLQMVPQTQIDQCAKIANVCNGN